MKRTVLILIFLLPIVVAAQTTQTLELNKTYSGIKIDKTTILKYAVHFEKDGVYKIAVLQEGIDVVVFLTDNLNKQLVEKDSPNGQNGFETFVYNPTETGNYNLTIKRFEENGNSEEGQVSITIKQLSKAELEAMEKIKKELEPENKKLVQMLDIDHFWETFDNLKNCKTKEDSIASFQKLYLDRATNGLEDFINARSFTAEKFVKAVAAYPKFYNSVRKNTFEVKKAAPIIDSVVRKFNEIYPNFKPFKVCFAIGFVSTGGTASDKFLLIGTEMTTSTKDVDLSEYKNSALGKILASGTDVVQNIKNMVAHEYVHTQQPHKPDSSAINCPLLYEIIREGSADFIGELLAGDQINKVAHEYGEKHEKELWQQVKNELCNEYLQNWLSNYGTVKDKPADLGYYIGYKIAEAYYQNAADKKQAIMDIIEMKDPITFLQKSKYDQKKKH